MAHKKSRGHERAIQMAWLWRQRANAARSLGWQIQGGMIRMVESELTAEKEAGERLRRIVEAVAGADEDDRISEIKVYDGNKAEWLRAAARTALEPA